MRTYKTACSLDCWDTCSIEATVSHDHTLHIKGDPHHPITQGFLCKKGLEHLNRINSPLRITSPMKKINGEWVKISWDKALSEISQQIREIINTYGPSSLLSYSEGGHTGLKKNIVMAFFNSLGKVTLPTGSLCWGAGIAAQTADFGNVLSHSIADVINSKTIVIWGRNPVNTNIHLVPYIKKAKAAGAHVILIDPIKTATADLATHYYQIRPESDGHLALAMAKLIIESDLHKKRFLATRCNDFEAFSKQLQSLKLEELIAETGLTRDEVIELTGLYATNFPSSIILGFGLQRYPNGGRNIRLIDTLAAMTGNIGIAGGGVSYANKFISQWIDSNYMKNSHHEDQPTFIRSKFSQYILEERPNEIKGMFITKGNPLLQLPNTSKTLEAFKSIPFKVTIDLFMTDTADASDYVLPCTHIFEEEDFIYTSMGHSYFIYTEQVISPKEGVKHEFEIFRELAEGLNMEEYLKHYGDEVTYMERSLLPLLLDTGMSLKELQGKSLSMKGNEIPWENHVFDTPDRKFQFINIDTIDLKVETKEKKEYPLQFLSLHPKHSLHSQHFLEVEAGVLPKVFCNSPTLGEYNLSSGDVVEIKSSYGEIKAVIEIDEGVGKNLLMVYEGWWLKHQGINHLTPDGISDIGKQATYNDCFCKINKVTSL